MFPAAARERGVVVCNTPGVLTEATADLAFTLLLALARRVREGERIVRTGAFGNFDPAFLLGRDLQGATLGLLGFGRIGQAVARRGIAFGMKVVFTTPRDPRTSAAAAIGARRVPLNALLRESDVLSIHAPLTPETRHVIDAAALASMKRDALLINTSRGPLVDESALVRALAENCFTVLGGEAPKSPIS